MISIEKMEGAVKHEGLFAAHAVGCFIQEIDDLAFWHSSTDAVIALADIFAGGGYMYAPTHIQAEEVIRTICNEAGNMDQQAMAFIKSADIRNEIGSVIAFARDRYLRYNR